MFERFIYKKNGLPSQASRSAIFYTDSALCMIFVKVGSRESNPDGGNLSAHITSVLTDGSEENEKITNRSYTKHITKVDGIGIEPRPP